MKTDRKKRLVLSSPLSLLWLRRLRSICHAEEQGLSESSIFDKAEVEALAGQVIDYINAEDYEGLRAMAVDEMADIMNQERMDEAKARVSEDWGAFQDVDSITTTEVNQRGKTAAVAYVAASYEMWISAIHLPLTKT